MDDLHIKTLYEFVDSLDTEELKTLGDIVTDRISRLDSEAEENFAVNASKINLPVMHKPDMPDDFDFSAVQRAWRETGSREKQKRKNFFGSCCGN